MVYELRTYWAAPGKIGDLHNRFRNVTLNIFARHNMRVIAFWTPSPVTETSGDLVYILAFDDAEAKEKAWNAFRSDPDWIAGRTASEINGALVSKITTVLLEPTDYSPLR